MIEETQDKKIDKLQFQMENVQGELKDLKTLSRETNERLETMQKGLVGREEWRELQAIIGKLASKEEVQVLKDDIKELKDWQTWAIRIVLGSVILGVMALLYATK